MGRGALAVACLRLASVYVVCCFTLRCVCSVLQVCVVCVLLNGVNWTSGEF